jgi:hypothetical protein
MVPLVCFNEAAAVTPRKRYTSADAAARAIKRQLLRRGRQARTPLNRHRCLSIKSRTFGNFREWAAPG